MGSGQLHIHFTCSCFLHLVNPIFVYFFCFDNVLLLFPMQSTFLKLAGPQLVQVVIPSFSFSLCFFLSAAQLNVSVATLLIALSNCTLSVLLNVDVYR